MLILSPFLTSILPLLPMDSSLLRYLSPTALRQLHEREKCQLCPWKSIISDSVSKLQIFDLGRTVNQRFDEWVKLDQLDLSSVETNVDEKVEDKVDSLITKSRTQVILDSHSICSKMFAASYLEESSQYMEKRGSDHLLIVCEVTKPTGEKGRRLLFDSSRADLCIKLLREDVISSPGSCLD
ncbi:hypothetical protein BUALT_Bualt02G0079900 [Buddleja alternifolia]|uniref:Uncharacterized protein n=1 Tax=Buddleja alternifolia TaxID=168488 RepID=A0AAV6Y0J8_9LAMI|nr:hypothetical protein BUALT_Bualt02G0079900 [Buddleja alternifolia]